MSDPAWVQVALLKPRKRQTVGYPAEVLWRTATSIAVRAAWSRGTVDLGYLCFEPGDSLIEYFYSDRWFNVFAIYGADGRHKGWYCNVTRPASLAAAEVVSEDLELDLFVTPDRATLLRLDVDEFESCGFAQHDPATYRAAYAALAELEALARAGAAPFDA
jgi:predicted RNA-binding protein associated with RNAse of E/G family